MKPDIVVALALLLPLAGGCSSSTPPVVTPQEMTLPGETLPSVEGKSLSGEVWRLPEDLAGKPAILLIGYVQEAQFDGDRWLIGLLQTQTPAKILEVPTIKGLVPSLISGRIDSGMREGIPSEDWASVVTVYGSGAGDLVEFTGNEKPRNMRVVLLDAEGRIRWFHDRGFSAGKVVELDALVRSL